MRRLLHFILATLLAGLAANAQTSHWPTQDGNYVIRNFHFGSGESIPELQLHYLTLGKSHQDAAGHTDNAVLLLHGTGGSAHSLLNPVFSDVLFGPGQPLDITKFFIILPDDIGPGESMNPSKDFTELQTFSSSLALRRSRCRRTPPRDSKLRIT